MDYCELFRSYTWGRQFVPVLYYSPPGLTLVCCMSCTYKDFFLLSTFFFGLNCCMLCCVLPEGYLEIYERYHSAKIDHTDGFCNHFWSYMVCFGRRLQYGSWH